MCWILYLILSFLLKPIVSNIKLHWCLVLNSHPYGAHALTFSLDASHSHPPSPCSSSQTESEPLIFFSRAFRSLNLIPSLQRLKALTFESFIYFKVLRMILFWYSGLNSIHDKFSACSPSVQLMVLVVYVLFFSSTLLRYFISFLFGIQLIVGLLHAPTFRTCSRCLMFNSKWQIEMLHFMHAPSFFLLLPLSCCLVSCCLG